MDKQELHNLFIEVYQNKKAKYITYDDVGERLGKSRDAVRWLLKKLNGYEDCPDVFCTILKPLHSFDELNEESSYWLGYLMADGCFTYNSGNKNSYCLMLDCKTEDKEILEKFCDFLGIRKNRITVGHKGASRALTMSANNFTTDLREYGLVPNKSHTENIIPSEIKKDENLFF